MKHFRNRFMAGALAFMVAVSSPQFSAGNVRAEEPGEITETGTAVEEAGSGEVEVFESAAGMEESGAKETGTVTGETGSGEVEVSKSATGTEESTEKNTETVTENIEGAETTEEAKTTVTESEGEGQDEALETEETEEESQTEEVTLESEEVAETEEILMASEGDNIASGQYRNVIWVIDANGKLTVEGRGEFANFGEKAQWYSYRDEIKSAQIRIAGIKSASNMFYDCSSLISVDLSDFDASQVTGLQRMFYGCSSLTEINLSGLDTSSVYNMDEMFKGCSSLTEINLSGLDTSSVYNMVGMFEGCSSLTEINLSGFDGSRGVKINNIFDGCNCLNKIYSICNLKASVKLPIGIGDVWKKPDGEIISTLPTDLGSSIILIKEEKRNGSYESITWVIDDDRKLIVEGTGEFGGFGNARAPWYGHYIKYAEINVTGIKNLYGMFYGCNNLISVDLSGLDTGNVTNMGSMFAGCSSLTSIDVSKLDTGNVTNMSSMFRGCSSLTSLDLSSFNTSNVTDMSSIFYGCSRLTSLNLRSFNTSNVTDMGSIFAGCSSLTSIDVSKLDTSNVTDMSSMFYGCSRLTSLNLRSFNTSNVTDMGSIFAGCSSLTSIDVSKLDTSNVTNMSSMFYGCSSLTSLDLSSFNTSNVTDMSSMFYDSSKLTSLNLRNFNTSNVTDMGSMFSGCSNLISLDLSDFDTGKVIYMGSSEYDGYGGMFSGCKSLTSLDLSSFDTSHVRSMRYMFSDCKSLTSLDLSSFDTSHIMDNEDSGGHMEGMFYDCSSLASLDLSSFDTSHVRSMYEMFSGCSSLTGLNLSNFDTGKVTDMGSMFSGCGNLINLDLSNFDAGNVEDMSSIFAYCDKLTTLYTPYNLQKSVLLSGNWYKVGGSKISSLPQNLNYSVLLTKDEVPSRPSPCINAKKEKTVYQCGDILYTDDLVVRCYDSEGNVRIVTDYDTNANWIDMSTSGTKNLKITYRGCLAEVPITVRGNETPVKISGLTVTDSAYTGRPFVHTGTAVVMTNKGDDVTAEVSLIYTYTGTMDDGSPYGTSETAPVNAGNYTMTAAVSQSDGKYSGSATYDFKITKAPVKVTASDLTLGIGSPLPETYEYQVTGLLNDDRLVKEPSFICNADMTKTGIYGIVPYGASAGMNYEITNINGTLVVKETGEAKETVTISGISIPGGTYTGKAVSYTGKAAAKLQDGTDITDGITLTYRYSGRQADGSEYALSETAPANAGNYVLTIAVSQSDRNYSGSAEYAFKITKAAARIMASDLTLETGSPLPETYEYQVTGLLNDDKLVKEPSFICNADMTKAGIYGIVPYDADAGMNYKLSYVNGTLVVKEKEIVKKTVTISGISMPDRIYTGKPVSYSGNAAAKLQDGTDVTDNVTFTYSYSGNQADGTVYAPSETAPVNAGSYILTVAVPEENGLYSGSMEYRFEIAKAQVTVTASDTVFETGRDTALPDAYPYETAGLLDGDRLTKEPVFTYTDIDGKETSRDSIDLKKAGRYNVIPKDADAGMNYEISYQKGVLTITGAGTDLPDDGGENEVLPDDIPESGIPENNTIWVSAVKDQPYTGAAVKPDVRVYSGKKRLTEKTDYTVSYKTNIKPGTADIIITGKGNYSDRKTLHFNIVPKDIADKDVIIEDMAYAADGKQHKAAPNVIHNGRKLKAGRDFDITYGDGDYTAAGDYYAVITGKGNYKGTYDRAKITVIDKNMLLNRAKITKIPNQQYNGGQEVVLPDSALKVTLNGAALTKGTDYTVDYINNRDAGKASVVLRGTGKYAGTKTVSFRIVRTPVNISGAGLVCEFDRETVFAKGGCSPVPEVSYNGETLRNGTDYTVSYKNNKKCGTASLTVKGKGNFKGSSTFSFTIKQKELSAVGARAADTAHVNKANKYQVKPVLTDTDGNVLKAGTDYIVTEYAYDGRALGRQDCPPENAVITVTVKGKGNYQGTCTASYQLRAGTSLGKAKITVAGQIYTGTSVKPGEDDITAASIKRNGTTENLVYGRDYEIAAYGTNVKKGSGTVVFRGLGNYHGEKTVKFKIAGKSVE